MYFTTLVLFFNKLKILLAAAILGVFTLLYAIPLGKNRQNLRNIGGIKIFIIAVVWAGVTVILPLLNQVNLKEIGFTFFQRFFFVIAITLPFEIRDLKFDSGDLNTIPQQIGVKKTKILGVLLLLIFLGLNFFKEEIITHFLYKEVIMTFILMLFVLFSSKKRNKYYTSFWVEALPIFWLMLMLL